MSCVAGTTSKLLASRSIDVNRSDNNQCTALHFAAFEGHVECVKLISGVADVNLDCTDKVCFGDAGHRLLSDSFPYFVIGWKDAVDGGFCHG